MKNPPQLPLNFEYRASLSGHDFIVCPANRDAVTWLDQWQQWNAPFLIIYGEKGCGKTHLCEVFCQAAQARKIVLSSNPYDVMEHTHVAVIDDVDELVKDHQQDLFHLYNYARENNAFVLLTAKTAVQDWSVDLPDLKSRLSSVPSVKIGQPDDVLMDVILSKQFHDRQIAVDPEIVAYIKSRIERSFESAQKAVLAIDAHALSTKRKITIPLVREVLQNKETS